MKKILITAIGGDIAQGVAKILRESNRGYQLIGTDVHDKHAGMLYVDKFYQVPYACDDKYISSFKEILKIESIDVVFPISEPEINLWNNIKELDSSICFITPGKEVVSVGLDKLNTARTLKKLGLSVPWTLMVSSGEPKSLPCILKSRTGSGSRNIFKLEDKADVEYYSSKFPNAIYQELVGDEENEITCAVYRTERGDVSIFQMLRKLIGGLTSWAEVIDNDSVKDMCEKIAIGLNLKGSMNIQLRLTDKGPRVFEINPRYSSTVVIRHRCGFQDVIWALDELDKAPVVFPRQTIGKKIVKTYDAKTLN